MHLPHHLVRGRSGLFHFRQKVPLDLQGITGRKVIKRSLHTRCSRTALAWAYVLSARYDVAFQAIRTGNMTKPTLEELLKLDTGNTRPYEITTTPGGGFSVKAADAEDHTRAMEALDRLLIGGKNLPSFPSFVPQPAPVQVQAPISLGKAHGAWVEFIRPSYATRAKTLKIKSAAVASFVDCHGGILPLDAMTRAHVASWVQAQRSEGCSTPTILNKLGYLAGFFEWAQGVGSYPTNDNPARGQLKYSAKEKRQRRKLGFKALTLDQIKTLYDGVTLAGLSGEARWGALLGLYTGARVSEIGQLLLVDFLTVDGVPCIRINDEGEGQSLKSDVSIRMVPIHPDLIRLGLLDRVEALRKQGETRFFPGVKVGVINGMGNWLGKAFTRYLDTCGVKPEGSGKVGFHSLRKSVIHAMQTGKVEAEYRAQFVGHDLDDEHHGTYSREYTPKELLEVIAPSLSWSLDLDAIKQALNGAARGRRKRAIA
jgi:integrase